MSSSPDSVLCPKIVSKVQLTQGDWEVVNKAVWWDDTRALVYFHGLKDTCLEKHLYVVSAERPGEVRRLTEPGLSHNVELGPDCEVMATVFSSVKSLPGCQVIMMVVSLLNRRVVLFTTFYRPLPSATPTTRWTASP